MSLSTIIQRFPPLSPAPRASNDAITRTETNPKQSFEGSHDTSGVPAALSIAFITSEPSFELPDPDLILGLRPQQCLTIKVSRLILLIDFDGLH